jgi:hypothetical protein
MTRTTLAALAVLLAAGPLSADEFTEVVEGALGAYADGDITAAREDLEYALKLLSEMKAEGLVAFLPEPLDGWQRELSEVQAGGAFAMFGGGTTASATYLRGGDEFTITLVANSPMVAGMGAMISGLGTMGGGRTIRIQRQQFAVTDGEIQGVVAGSVLVQASGQAPVEAMQAHLETMDMRGLGEF